MVSRRFIFLAGVLTVFAGGIHAATTTLLNVSYDATREFYKDYNAAFAARWRAMGRGEITINQSHGGSSKQVRSVIDGLGGDVVTMNQALDIDQLATAGFVSADWATRLPQDSVPYLSTILFLVRKGNPKGIHDWPDLVRDDVAVVVPNPKTSGNGRYSYLAAWGYARRRPGGSDATAREFVQKLFARVPILDTGSRGATTSFARHDIGDVLLTFENEIALIGKELNGGQFERIVPSVSIRADNPVVWVDRNVAKRGTEEAARAYLEYLYSPEAQELAAKHHFRPQDPAVAARHADKFPRLVLFSVAEVFGSWRQAQEVHFADGGVFDQIHPKQ
ncbi:MAG TPA: sulfate ABC transporter substrate-binding protein [Opitutaceae bacterium]